MTNQKEEAIMYPVLSWNQSFELNETYLDVYDFYKDMDLDSYPDVLEVRVVPFIFLVILITGISGNVLVLYVFVRNKTYRTVTNIFLLNLAIVDLVYLCLCCPFTTANVHMRHWPFGNVLCKTVAYLMVVCMSVNVLTLIAIGLDRYVAIIHPVRSRLYRNRRNTVIIILVCWIASLAGFVPILDITRILLVYDTFCIEELSPKSRTVYTTLMFIIFYVIPQILLGYCYTQIALRIQYNMRRADRLNQVTLVTLKIRGRIIKMTLMVTLAFTVCWLPLHIAAIMSALHVDVSLFSYYLQIFAPCFAYTSVSLNPVIYCFMSKTFRKFLKAAFTCRKVRLIPPLVGPDVDYTPQNTIPSRRSCQSNIQLENIGGAEDKLHGGQKVSTWNSLNELDESSDKMEEKSFTQEILIDKECQTDVVLTN